MHRDSRVARSRAGARLLSLGLVLLLLSALLAGCGGSGRNVTLRVIYAGSLLIPFPALQKEFEASHPGVKIESEAHGSIQVLRQVSDLHQKADVLISADCNLIPLLLYNTPEPDTGVPYADWYVKFATNEMAIAFTEKSQWAAEITSDNWYQVIARPGVRVGIADPRFDANGYRALMVLKLADAVYKKPTLFPSRWPWKEARLSSRCPRSWRHGRTRGSWSAVTACSCSRCWRPGRSTTPWSI
jgi:molybdate/tungstate transport system substrate-binding protein